MATPRYIFLKGAFLFSTSNARGNAKSKIKVPVVRQTSWFTRQWHSILLSWICLRKKRNISRQTSQYKTPTLQYTNVWYKYYLSNSHKENKMDKWIQNPISWGTLNSKHSLSSGPKQNLKDFPTHSWDNKVALIRATN